MLSISCPQCTCKIDVTQEDAGSMVQCEACDHQFKVVKSAIAPSLRTQRPLRPRREDLNSPRSGASSPQVLAGSGTSNQVSILKASLIGAVLASLLYGLVFYPLRHTELGQLFTARGWVPYAIVFLTSWATTILAFKFVNLRRQRASLQFELLPRHISDEITQSTACEFTDHLESLEERPFKSLILSRIWNGMERFKARGEPHDVATILESQSDIDGMALENSYSTLRVIIWAIPILGFIGTVIGISTAVGGFSGAIDTANVPAAEQALQIKESLGEVTSGLGVAFHTTLIALVMSVFLMFLMHWLEKSEEELLTAVSDYCNREFLVRLTHTDQDDSKMVSVITQSISAVMDSQRADRQSWTKTLEELGEKQSSAILESWKKVNADLQVHQENHVKRIDTAISGVLSKQQKELDSLRAQLIDSGTLMASTIAEKVNEAHDAMIQTQKAQMEQGERILEEASEERRVFVEEIKPLHASQMEELGKLVASMSEATKSSQENLKEASEVFEDGVTKWKDAFEEVVKALNGEVLSRESRWTKMLDASMTRAENSARLVQETAEATQSSFAASLTELPEKLKAELKDFAEYAASLTRGHQEALVDVAAKLEKSVGAFSKSLDTLRAEDLKHLAAAAAVLKEVGDGLNKTLPDQVERQIKVVETTLSAYEKLQLAQDNATNNLKILSCHEPFKLILATLRDSIDTLEPAVKSLEKRVVPAVEALESHVAMLAKPKVPKSLRNKLFGTASKNGFGG